MVDSNMNSENKLLIDQLRDINRFFASFVDVIIHVSEKLTKGTGKNDFDHAEAVQQRLSELFPNAREFGLSAAEIFILISSSYLHDIGYSNIKENQRHGMVSADMITQDDSLKCIFPSGDVQNQVARVCNYHDQKIEDLSNLEENVKLDIRPCRCLPRSEMKVRPRMLGAIFRLADELECNSDRILLGARDEPRKIIAGVRIDLELRSICLDFKHGSTEEMQFKCVEYLKSKINILSKILDPYGLAFKIVDKLPKIKSTNEDESLNAKVNTTENVEDVSKTCAISQKEINTDNLTEIYQKERMNRVDSIMKILSERGRIK